MTWHDDANDPTPEGGYCPVCYDVGMIETDETPVEGFEVVYKCPSCGLLLDWKSDEIDIVIPPYEG